MAGTEQQTRADVDIHEDIKIIVAHYPPMVSDRRHLAISVKKGKVSLTGHLKTEIIRQYLLDNIRPVAGVRKVDASKLYVDEELRRAVGQVLPPGVFANVENGIVTLSGQLPPEVKNDALLKQVKKISGVAAVVSRFMQA